MVGADRVLGLDSLVGRSQVLGLDPLLGGSQEDRGVLRGGRELGPSTQPCALIALHHQYHAHDLRSGRDLEQQWLTLGRGHQYER